MNFQTIQSIYPESTLNLLPSEDQGIVSFPVSEGFAWIKRTELGLKEEQLLQALLPQKKATSPAIQHQWYRILFKDEPAAKETTLRVIQLQLKPNTGFLKKEWQNEIRDMFPALLDCFFLDDTHVFIVEEKKDTNYTAEEIFGLFQALDSDFDVYSQIFVGAFHKNILAIYENFQEERKIFQKQLTIAGTQKEFPFTQSAIAYLVEDTIKENFFMRSFYEEWFVDDMSTILQSLWHNQGNVSSTSKELFLHRNTLLYRLDKFQEETKLDVKNMDDLMFCHLLISCFGTKRL
ncbi:MULTISPECIES: helix-turn-helix domain-containing protein [Enterococcus]|uniref:helix-turn-helix domain-containing protein n=1 Tax=Enterococcus TaxID=1350 RepID=UPI0010F8D35B|nr:MULTISPECIES: helix-turn-helix domain-containing protein [Enterococcus]KAF1303957.1 hypothetical protein BAU16_02975 [Enterococcus sp. JM9B]